jgi:hypothetical protein
MKSYPWNYFYKRPANARWSDFWAPASRYVDNEGDVWRSTGWYEQPTLLLERLEEDAAPVPFGEVATRAALGPLRLIDSGSGVSS